MRKCTNTKIVPIPIPIPNAQMPALCAKTIPEFSPLTQSSTRGSRCATAAQCPWLRRRSCPARKVRPFGLARRCSPPFATSFSKCSSAACCPTATCSTDGSDFDFDFYFDFYFDCWCCCCCCCQCQCQCQCHSTVNCRCVERRFGCRQVWRRIGGYRRHNAWQTSNLRSRAQIRTCAVPANAAPCVSWTTELLTLPGGQLETFLAVEHSSNRNNKRQQQQQKTTTTTTTKLLN